MIRRVVPTGLTRTFSTSSQAKSRFYAFYFARPCASFVSQVNGIVERVQEDQTISIEVLHKEKACSIPIALRRGSASYAG